MNANPPEAAPATGTASASASGSVDVAGLRSLLVQRRFAEVPAAADALLAATPGHRDALLYKAIAERNLGRVADAFRALDELGRTHPDFSRLHEERGHCFVAQRQAREAIAAFQRAVQLNHALPASWSMLEGLHRMCNEPQESQAAASQLATLRKLPPAVVAGTALFLDGDLDEAEPLVRSFLLQQGDEIEAMRLLARIGVARKVYDDAELLLAAVVARAPDYRAARLEYAEVLMEMQKHAHARNELERLGREDPGNRLVYQGSLATALVGLGEHERAIALYRELLEVAPDDADARLSVGHALKTVGRFDEAVEAYRGAAASRHGFGDAYWSLANLKTYRFAPAEIEALERLEAEPGLRAVDRYHLCFALGKALEDQQRYAESWRYYQRGNELKRAESRYRPEIIETNTRQQVEVCTAEFFAQHAAAGAQDPDPIFIVGLPRSGSTLLEQILASHSLIEGTQELANIQQLVGRLRGRQPDLRNPNYPRILRELTDEDFRKFGEQYLADTRTFRHGKPHFIDKMPNNFRHIGLIHLILPHARIIDARREPMACCFSNLKQLFAKGQEFTYSFEDIGRYYRTYLELMRHWDRVLPGRILRVHHEDVVEDLEGSVRRLLDFCGLEFEPACVDFHRTKRSVRTASSEQVRQPIYREGLEHWRHYEAWLDPLRDTLGDALTRYRGN
jgi:tetratricopeptide (TPR) repeat protein